MGTESFFTNVTTSCFFGETTTVVGVNINYGLLLIEAIMTLMVKPSCTKNFLLQHGLFLLFEWNARSTCIYFPMMDYAGFSLDAMHHFKHDIQFFISTFKMLNETEITQLFFLCGWKSLR